MQTIIDVPSSLLPLLGPVRGWSCCGAVTSEDTKKAHHAPLSECEWKSARQFTFIFFVPLLPSPENVSGSKSSLLAIEIS